MRELRSALGHRREVRAPREGQHETGRTWYGYSAYQPENIGKVLAVFRAFYN
jgi:hypothetical protein